MNWRMIASCVALGLALVTPGSAAAEGRDAAPQGDVMTASGPIERVDREGRIYVSGQSFSVTEDTEIFDQLRRTVAPGELTVGVAVEVTFESSGGDSAAKLIVATLFR